MSNLSSPASSSQRQRKLFRVVALVACVLSAWVAAMVTRAIPERLPLRSAVLDSKSTGQIEEETASGILEDLPMPSVSASGKAIASATEKVRKTPENSAAWSNLGEALGQELRNSANQKYYDFAESAFRYALRLNSKNVDALSGMAWVSGGRHVFKESIDWANQALAIDPSNSAAEGIIGDAELELGNYDQALNHYQKMMDLRPDLSSWSRGAYLLWIMGDKTKAVWLMEKAIKAGSPFPENTGWCRAKLAMMHFSAGELEDATRVIEPALATTPHNIQIGRASCRERV